MSAHADDDGPSGTLPIADLVEVCEELAARNRAWFETLGAWVVDEADPVTQRWFAVAAHRHAWHAELWAERRPKVPLEAGPRVDTTLASDDRATAYLVELAATIERLGGLDDRIDPELDPSTARVVRLVRADVADLLASAP